MLVKLTRESKLTSGLRKPLQIRNELYDSEKDYVKNIETLLLAYLVPMSEHPISYNFQNRCRADLLELIIVVQVMHSNTSSPICVMQHSF